MKKKTRRDYGPAPAMTPKVRAQLAALQPHRVPPPPEPKVFTYQSGPKEPLPEIKVFPFEASPKEPPHEVRVIEKAAALKA